MLRLLDNLPLKSDHVISLIDSFHGWAILPKMVTVKGYVEFSPDLSGSKVSQIAAGSQDTAGQAAPGTRCTRLKTEGMKGLGGGALAALLLAAGGAIAAAIIAGRSGNNDLNFGGNVVVISPTK